MTTRTAPIPEADAPALEVLASGRLVPDPKTGKARWRPWRSNAEMIADVARLWIDDNDVVVDPTYGEGNWWTEFRPRRLLTHDLHKGDGVDFRALPEQTGSIDVVAFDPPYVAMGGRDTSTLDYTGDRFGMDSAPGSPDGVRELIAGGIREAERVLRPARRGQRPGRLLVKCQDYISSGRLQPGSVWVLEDALALGGLVFVDRFEFISHKRPQPATYPCGACQATGKVEVAPGRGLADEAAFAACEPCGGAGELERRQVHARRNLSTLLVFERNRSQPAASRLF